MNDILTPDQIADLAGISQICEELGDDLVGIGATRQDVEPLTWYKKFNPSAACCRLKGR
jgi:hypothetical protein